MAEGAEGADAFSRSDGCQRVEMSAESVGGTVVLLDPVVLLLRIVFEVVELGFRRADELPRALPDRCELAPAIEEAGHETLRVERPCLGLAVPVKGGREALSRRLDVAGRADAQHLQHRREDVHALDGDVELGARRNARTAREERNVERRVVDEVAVSGLAVLLERLAVIGGDEEERALGEAELR